MENLSEIIIGGIITAAPIILLIIKLFATEYVTNFTKELFKSKTKKRANLIFNGIIVFLLIIGVSIILSPYLMTENPPIDNDTNDQQSAQHKSNGELIYDGAKIIYNDSKEGIKNKKQRDSIIKADREKKYVYKIGTIKDNDDAVLKLYKQLKNVPSVNLSRIFAFRISKNKYFLYENDEYNKNQINDSLLKFKAKIDSIEPYIKIINLMEYCKVKEFIQETTPLKFKKEKIEIPVCNCDK